MSETKPRKEKLLELLKTGLIGGLTAAVGIFILNNFIHLVIVSGSSMEPTYFDGDVVYCAEVEDEPLAVGDVVVMTPQDDQVIKRVIALPGDIIWVANGILYVNGRESPYQYEAITSPGILAGSVRLLKDEYFMMGDNRNHSFDCRDYGPVNISKVKYKVLKKLL